MGSLSSSGGGEQSLIKISQTLITMGWKVNLIPWGDIDNSFKNYPFIQNFSFLNGMKNQMKKDLPLFFYGNDQVYTFSNQEDVNEVVNYSSCIILGINFVVGSLPRSKWLSDSKKIIGAIFLNNEKKESWEHLSKKYYDYGIDLQVIPPCISTDNFIKLPIKKRSKNENIVILRHSREDEFKFITKNNYNQGENIYPWQEYLTPYIDIVFYKKIIESIPNIHFKFMVGSQDIIKEFKNHPNFTFYHWNEIKVEDFLKSGHLYLYRVSKSCRDQGPRVVCEAMAAGLPCISEPRDGTKDRINHGYNGFYAIQSSDYISKIKMLLKNEDLRMNMAKNARKNAIKNFQPENWGKKIDKLLLNKI